MSPSCRHLGPFSSRLFTIGFGFSMGSSANQEVILETSLARKPFLLIVGHVMVTSMPRGRDLSRNI